MAKYRVTGPDGAAYNITAPDGVSDLDVAAAVSRQLMQQPQPAASKPKPSGVASGLEGVAQGVTFNFADELEGAARTGLAKLTGDDRELGEIYADKVKIPRDRVAAAKQANPIAFHGAEIGSSLFVPGGLAKLGIRGPLAAAGSGLGTRSLAAAKEGAAYGAAYGAGAGEGVADTLSKAATGGSLGGAIGAAVPGVVDAASAVTSRIMTPVKAAIDPKGHAGTKLAEAFERDAALPGAATASPRELDRVVQRFDSMSAANPRTMLADAGDENVRNLLRASANQSSSAAAQMRRTLDARQATQHVRLADSVGEHLRDGRALWDRVDEIIATRDATAKPAFAEAFAEVIQPSQKLAEVAQRPTMKRILEDTQRSIADRGEDLSRASVTEIVHRAKMQLDDTIGAVQRGQAGDMNWNLNDLRKLKSDLVASIGNPKYEAALKQYAGQSALKNAAEDGADMFTKGGARDMAKQLASYTTESERELFRQGAAAKLVDSIYGPGMTIDKVKNMFASPEMHQRMRVIFPDVKSRREFQKALIIEARMAGTRQAVQGNSTTAKQLTQASEAMEPARGVSAVANAALGRLEPIANFAARQYNRFAGGLTPSVANEVLNMAMSKDPRVLQGLSEAALRRAAEVPASRASLSEMLISGEAAALANANSRRDRR